MGKSKVLSHGFCLFDSETEQRALQLLHIYCSDVRSHSSVPESNEQTPRDRTLDLPLFRYKRIPSLKNLLLPAPSEGLPYWFQGNFAAMFVPNYWLKEFPLSSFANLFQLRCEVPWVPELKKINKRRKENETHFENMGGTSRPKFGQELPPFFREERPEGRATL